MESNTIFEILNGGLLKNLLSVIEESGVTAAQAREIPHLLEDTINTRNEEMLARERFSASIGC